MVRWPAAAQGQIARQATRIRQLESKLSQLLGEQAWRESGLVAPEDVDQLKRRITELCRPSWTSPASLRNAGKNSTRPGLPPWK